MSMASNKKELREAYELNDHLFASLLEADRNMARETYKTLLETLEK
jgi:hypothetical protein